MNDDTTWDVMSPMNIVVGWEKPWLLVNTDGSVVFYRRDGSERLRLTEEQFHSLIERLATEGEKQ